MWGQGKCTQDFGGKIVVKNHWQHPGIDVKIIIKWILKKQDGMVWCGMNLSHSAQRQMVGFHVYCNGSLG